MKKLSRSLCIIGLSLPLLLATSCFVFAAHDSGQGKSQDRKSVNNPELVTCLLLLAGGVTLARLRRWRNQKNSNNQKNMSKNPSPSTISNGGRRGVKGLRGKEFSAR